MSKLSELLGLIVVFGSWFSGIAIANGIISTAFSIVFPPYAWYLFVERLLIAVELVAK